MTRQTPLTGGCLCEAVRYEIRGPVRPVVNCHCTQCRKTSGHFVAATETPREALTLLAAGGLRWYRSSEEARRGFCARCGTFVFWKAHDEDTISFSLGVLEDPTGLRLERHIFVADKGDYYDIADGLPQWERS